MLPLSQRLVDAAADAHADAFFDLVSSSEIAATVAARLGARYAQPRAKILRAFEAGGGDGGADVIDAAFCPLSAETARAMRDACAAVEAAQDKIVAHLVRELITSGAVRRAITPLVLQASTAAGAADSDSAASSSSDSESSSSSDDDARRRRRQPPKRARR